MLLVSQSPYAARFLDPPRVDTMLSTALAMAATLPLGNRDTITLHTESQQSS